MMTLTTRIALGLASFGFASLLGVSPAQAGGGDRGGHKTPEQKAERLCAKLACTAAQKAKIVEIKAAGRTPQSKAARDNLHGLKQQLRAERQKPSPDAKLITRLEAQVTAQKTALAGQRKAQQQKVLAVLNADQKAKFQAHLDARAKRHADGKGKHGGKGKRGGKRMG